jgi:acyl-CoA reductase-like NAD-dependent aldehyde dehydrogenase
MAAGNAPLPTTGPVGDDGFLRGISPVDRGPLDPVAITPPGEVATLVAAARAAQPAWAARGLKARAQALRGAAMRMLERRAEVLALMRRETGKLPVEGLMSEAIGPLDQVKQWVALLKRHAKPRRLRANPLAFPGKRVWLELVPRGVVGAITPWNYPLATFFRPVLPALLAGNGVVIKPSEHSPRTAAWFVAVLREFLPAGLVGLAQGGAPQGRALLEAGIDACTFTGSVPAGREVSKRCGERLIPCSVELGGKDAAIVLADCDLDRTLAGVTNWKLHNAGQNCGAIERLYVEQPVADEFVRRLGEAWGRLRTTDDDDGDVSPLSNPRQLDVVERHVADARARGAAVVCGGARTGAGLGYLPTVLDRCTEDMAVMREETFGPVLAVVRVKDAEEAVAAANRSDFGLGGSVWTRDLARGRALAGRLACGVVNVNNHAVSGALVSAPWTGVKDTGGGVANSEYALTTFLRPRTVLVDRSTKPDMFWLPFDADLVDTGDRLARLQLGRLGAVFGLFGALKRRLRAIRDFFAARG